MSESPASQTPRIAPGSRRDTGTLNMAIARALGLATGGGPPHVFTTLGRQRRLFRGWLHFGGTLMPGGSLPRADSELVILRVARNCDCAYERQQHEPLARSAGLTAADLERVREDAGAEGWTERQRLLLRAADELHDRRDLCDELWDALAQRLPDPGLIELVMLIGHYEMLAATLNTLRVQPDVLPARQPRLSRLLQSLAGQRS